MLFHGLLAGHQHGGGPVVYAGGVARGDAAAFCLEGRRQLGELLDSGAGTRVLVGVEDQRLLLATRNLDGDDFLGKATGLLGLGDLGLGARGEGVLVLAGDAELLGHVLCGLGHRVGIVDLLHQRIDEAPADGGVLDLLHGRRRSRPCPSRSARDMDSTPPASASSISPALMARKAVPTASMPEPHRRLSVVPGTEGGRPASSDDMRATLRLSSPA